MAVAETDPYLVPGPHSLATTRRWVRAAIVLGVAYVVYRAAFTLDGAAPDAGVLLLTAEALTLAVFAIRANAAWCDADPGVDMPDAPVPATTVVIDARDATIADLRATLLSCRRLRGSEQVIVADPDANPEVDTLAGRFGAPVVPTAALDAAADASAMWVLLIRAGDLPLPDALELLATACSAPDAGIVQLGVEHANPSSFEHDPSGGWSLAPFEHQIVRPSLAARGTMLWYGDVPAMVRPAAIRDSVEEGTSTVVAGLQAMSRGYRVTMMPRTLARLRGPASLGESLRRRFEQTAEIRRRAPQAIRLAPGPVRRQFIGALADPLAAVQRFMLALVAVLALGLGRLPVAGSALPLTGAAALAYGVRWQAQTMLGRGRLGRFRVLRSELRSIGVDLAFGHGLGVRHGRHRLLLLTGMSVAVALAAGVGAMAVWKDSPERLPAIASAVALILSAGYLIVAADVIVDASARRQVRSDHRVRLGLVTGRLGDLDGQLRDISVGGLGLTLTGDAAELPPIGSHTTVSFRIPDADGAWRDVETAVRIAHVAAAGDQEHRVGMAFLAPTSAALDPVVEFLTIDRRLVALGRRAPSAGEEAWPGLV